MTRDDSIAAISTAYRLAKEALELKDNALFEAHTAEYHRLAGEHQTAFGEDGREEAIAVVEGPEMAALMVAC